LFLVLYLDILFSITLIYYSLFETMLYDNHSNIITNNIYAETVRHTFNYIYHLPKYTPSFIMRHMSSSPPYSSPILDAALSSSLDGVNLPLL
jgi:hypothetical protein